jgi:hypothetical protein
MSKTPFDEFSSSDDEMLPEYQFDYSKAKPNRFAVRNEEQETTVILDKVVVSPSKNTAEIRQGIFNFFKEVTRLVYSVGVLLGITFFAWKATVLVLGGATSTLDYIEKLYASGNLPLPLILSIVTALATVFTATITTLIAKNNEIRLQIRTEQRDKKALIYEELTEFFFRIIFSSKTEDDEKNLDEEDKEKEIVEFLTRYTPKIIMWGSDEVLKNFYLFRNKSLSVESDPNKVVEVIRKFEELLFSIRRDLGHKNKNLSKGNILGLFINDVEKIL